MIHNLPGSSGDGGVADVVTVDITVPTYIIHNQHYVCICTYVTVSAKTSHVHTKI